MEQIYKYIETHATMPNEALDWVVKQTHIRTNHARMLSGLAQGQLLRMFTQMVGAKNILELGTFTGFSAICLASGLQDGGKTVRLWAANLSGTVSATANMAGNSLYAILATSTFKVNEAARAGFALPIRCMKQ